MKSPLLIIDTSNICHRIFYALSQRGPTSVADINYSFLQTLKNLRTKFGTDRFVFCFDSRVSLRRTIFADYKRKRQAKAVADEERLRILNDQLRILRKKVLPELGFSNIFRARGYESDDLMAAIAREKTFAEIVLITSDSDLLQCLRPNVSIYSPRTKKMITDNSFMEAYGIRPKKWALVKAIAGCSTDEIPGLLGVGETGALKYIRGELKETSSQFIWITCEKGQESIRQCLRLVRLPFAECPVPQITKDQGDPWHQIERIRL